MTPETKAKLESILASLPTTMGDVTGTEAFQNYQSESVQSGGYSHNSDKRDRFSRCHDAAENGSDGSTHSEHIDDARSFGEELFRDAERATFHLDLTEEEEKQVEEQIEMARTAFDTDCDAVEAWHEKNGSLNQEVG